MLFALDHTNKFPPVHLAEPDGLLAMGGDLNEERLLNAYQGGIFPWFEGEIPLWWSPDPRFVLFPGELNVSKSMKVLLKRNAFEFTVNNAFDQVINQCKTTFRKGQAGTWITNEVEMAYKALHRSGYAHSAEAWENGVLVGGLYGVRMGKVFFGESMFSRKSNASKYAFISFVRQLELEDVELIDCQVYTEHLETLGARMIERKFFMELLNEWT